MTKPEHDPSVHSEPQLKKTSFSPDLSDERAASLLAGQRDHEDPDHARAMHSVFDEPAVLPNREPVLIDRDWYCRQCGYNLRGLATGHPCPECGVVERYEPPREGEDTYARWLAENRGPWSQSKSWAVAALMPILGVPFAIACSPVLVESRGLFAFAVIGPALAECIKISGGLILIERRSPLVRRSGQLYLMTLGTSVVFAAVFNLLYLTVVAAGSPSELVAYRWTICFLLHGVCTYIATCGLVAVWRRARREQGPPRLSAAVPFIVAAILLHAAYNACVFVTGKFGYGF